MRVVLLLGLLLFAMAGACGDGDPEGSASEDVTGDGPSGTDLPTPTRPTGPPSAPTDVIEKSRVSGVLERGGGCAVLVGPNGRWALLDPDPAWEDGARLRVTGRARPELGSPCDGIAFSVLRVEVLDD